MQQIKIAAVDKEKFYKIPKKAHPTDGAYDIYVAEDVYYPALNQTVICPTNVKLEIPEGWCARVWPRSGLGAKGIKIHPGLIDYGFTSEVKVIVYIEPDFMNLEGNAHHVLFKQGERIAQLELRKLDNYILTEEEFDGSDSRGGFGSSGKDEFTINKDPELVKESVCRNTRPTDLLL